jgi:outer membrane lipoprotein-sorting protein
MNARTVSAAAMTLGVALLGATPLLGATASGPAAAFLEAWAKVPSYTANITVHETKGTDVQDRTYHYAYLKPHFAKIDITGGPGRGGGASWTGGDHVSGHQGGILSGIHLNVSIHDGRAVDLRGATIDMASFENMAEAIKAAPSVTNGEETVNGTAYDTVTYPYKDDIDATTRVVYLSRATHLPARRVTYAGDKVVATEDFTDVNTSANLKESDF